MQNSNLDVWAIQDVKEEINDALENVIDSKTNMLFRNCFCKFNMEKETINVMFDTMFYSEESDTLILLMKNGALKDKELKEELDRRQITYNEIVFADLDFPYEVNKDEKTIWFAREKYVLEDAYRDSIEKGNLICKYYPYVEAKLSMEYLTSTITSEIVDGRNFNGVIEFDDKLIFLVSQNDKRNVTMREVLQMSELTGVSTIVGLENEIPSQEKPKQKIK